VKIRALLNDITALMRDNNLVLPADLTLLFKTLITLEGLGQQLDPEFHMIDHVTPFRGAHHSAALHPAGAIRARAQERARGAGSGGPTCRATCGICCGICGGGG